MQIVQRYTAQMLQGLQNDAENVDVEVVRGLSGRQSWWGVAEGCE